ncbi:hypothetical protein OPQ81_002004 [Rhizoctonia solani]|nr:hypothetical protein OPQ81_002004 [Rhizoctonia solani]
MMLADMIRSLSPQVTRTPSLTDTDSSAPSEDLPEPSATITTVMGIAAPMSATTTKGSLMRAPSTVMTVESRPSRMRANSRSSTIMMMFQPPLVVALSEPRIVGMLVRYLSWHEFRMLAMVSHAVRSALEAEECMDPVLARFIPGYTLGARPEEQLHVSLDTLELFMLSQHMSVHLYPTHALSVIDSLMNAMHLASKTTERFQALTAAHSRMVLLLRSRALAAPNRPEIDEQQPSPPGCSPARVSSPFVCCCPIGPSPVETTGEKGRVPPQFNFLTIFALPWELPPQEGSSPSPPTQKTHRSSIYQSLEKRSSVYSTNGPQFSNSSQRFTSTSRRSSRPTRSKSTPPVHPRPDDDLSSLKPPRPWYRRHSSLPGTPASSSRGSLTAVSESVREHGPGAPLLPSGPHDLLYALVPGRAPVLRVFVPTDVLSPESIRACETLLFRAGLWDSMKEGDIVCNLGYVPRASTPGLPDQFGRLIHSSDAGRTEWLIFTGHALVPYVPPPVLPHQTLTYFPFLAQRTIHICPAVGGLVYAFSVPRRSTEPTLTLDSSVGYVKSSRGVARVWRPVWIASFRVDQTWSLGSRKGKQRANSTLAEEWTGEWVLEGMGTREGQAALLNAIDDGHVRFWEWVREKSSPGRVWFRLVDAPVLGVTEVVPPVPVIPKQYLPQPTTHITDALITEEPTGSSAEGSGDDTLTSTPETTPSPTVDKHRS